MATNKYFIEMTDTYSGEANYSWLNRFLVTASTMRGAMRKVARETGTSVRKVMDCGDFQRWDAAGACICFLVNESDGNEVNKYSRVKEL